MTMCNEAYGFFSTVLAITFLICIPTAGLWIILLKNKKQKTLLEEKIALTINYEQIEQ